MGGAREGKERAREGREREVQEKEGDGREKGEREGKGKEGRGGKGKEGEESASPFPNCWIRPCNQHFVVCQVKHFHRAAWNAEASWR